MATFEEIEFLAHDIGVSTSELRELEAEAAREHDELEVVRNDFLIENAEAFATGEIAEKFEDKASYYRFNTTLGRGRHTDPFDRFDTVGKTIATLCGLSEGEPIVAIYSPSTRAADIEDNRAGAWTVGRHIGEPSFAVQVKDDLAALMVNVCVEGATGRPVTGSIKISEIVEYHLLSANNITGQIDRPSVSVGIDETREAIQQFIGAASRLGSHTEGMGAYFRDIEYRQSLLCGIVRSNVLLTDLEYDQAGLDSLRERAIKDIDIAGNYAWGGITLAVIDGKLSASKAILKAIKTTDDADHVRRQALNSELAFILRHQPPKVDYTS